MSNPFTCNRLSVNVFVDQVCSVARIRKSTQDKSLAAARLSAHRIAPFRLCANWRRAARVGIHGEQPTRWLPRAPAEFTRRPTPSLSAAAPRRKTRFARVLDETRDFERLKRSPMCETQRTMHTANAGSGARLGQSVDTATGKTLRSESRRQAMGFTRRGHRNPQRPGWGDRQLRLASQTLSGLTASWLLPTAAPAGAAINARLSEPLPGVAGGRRWLRWRGRTRGVHRAATGPIRDAQSRHLKPEWRVLERRPIASKF
jgi:hypothetical protein